MSLHYNADISYLFAQLSISVLSRSVSNKFDYIYSGEVSFKGNVYDFSVDYDAIHKSNILNILKYLMIKKYIKYLELFLKNVLLLTNVVNASNHAKYVSLSNQKCEIQPTLINLYPKEFNQELHYYHYQVRFYCFVAG